MRLPEEFRPVVAAFRGEQFKATAVLLTSLVLMLTWKYFGSPEFYADHFSSRLVLFGDPAATAAVYCFGVCFVLLGVVPALIVKLLFRQRLSDYGVQLGDRARAVKSLLVLAPLFVLVAYLSSFDPAIGGENGEYPINRSAGASPEMFGLHALTYLLFYLGWEFHFRGFLQFGLRDKLGAANALLVQVMASTLLHIGKPCIETYGAILGGILWGLLAYRTRSLLAGLLQHFLLGISLDWFICYL